MEGDKYRDCKVHVGIARETPVGWGTDPGETFCGSESGSEGGWSEEETQRSWEIKKKNRSLSQTLFFLAESECQIKQLMYKI